MSPVRLRYVRVLDDRVDLVLEADPTPTPREVSERAAERLLAWLPGLESHRCSTGDTRTFTEEMRDTETPHLFEHVVLEVLARTGSPDGVRGETVWRRGEDAYLVSIFDDDDALCLSAARLALRLVDLAFGDGGPLDLDAEIARVAALR
ncbi:MAG: cyanophycin synthetase family protein [Coriobacteriia bacterium]